MEIASRHPLCIKYLGSIPEIFLLGQHTDINRHVEHCISAHRHWRSSRGHWNTDIVATSRTTVSDSSLVHETINLIVPSLVYDQDVISSSDTYDAMAALTLISILALLFGKLIICNMIFMCSLFKRSNVTDYYNFGDYNAIKVSS